jgi:hypothetical protein
MVSFLERVGLLATRENIALEMLQDENARTDDARSVVDLPFDLLDSGI